MFKNVDIIQSNQFWGSWIGLIASKLYKKKFILREGFQFYQFQTKLNKNKKIKLYLIKKFSYIIYTLTHKIIVTSNEHKNYLINNFGINEIKIFIIPNFIDTKIFKNYHLKKHNRLLFIGRLNYQKNIELAINAISNSDYVLDIIGHGEKKRYIELSKNLNSKVNFLENVPNNELVNFYNKCSFYIICSHFEEIQKLYWKQWPVRHL